MREIPTIIPTQSETTQRTSPIQSVFSLFMSISILGWMYFFEYIHNFYLKCKIKLNNCSKKLQNIKTFFGLHVPNINFDSNKVSHFNEDDYCTIC